MASVLLPLAVGFLLSMCAGLAVGRRAVLLPIVVGVSFGALIALNGAGDTAVGFLIVWLVAGVALGAWGALAGARLRGGRS